MGNNILARRCYNLQNICYNLKETNIILARSLYVKSCIWTTVCKRLSLWNELRKFVLVTLSLATLLALYSSCKRSKYLPTTANRNIIPESLLYDGYNLCHFMTHYPGIGRTEVTPTHHSTAIVILLFHVLKVLSCSSALFFGCQCVTMMITVRQYFSKIILCLHTTTSCFNYIELQT